MLEEYSIYQYLSLKTANKLVSSHPVSCQKYFQSKTGPETCVLHSSKLWDLLGEIKAGNATKTRFVQVSFLKLKNNSSQLSQNSYCVHLQLTNSRWLLRLTSLSQHKNDFNFYRCSLITSQQCVEGGPKLKAPPITALLYPDLRDGSGVSTLSQSVLWSDQVSLLVMARGGTRQAYGFK